MFWSNLLGCLNDFKAHIWWFSITRINHMFQYWIIDCFILAFRKLDKITFVPAVCDHYSLFNKINQTYRQISMWQKLVVYLWHIDIYSCRTWRYTAWPNKMFYFLTFHHSTFQFRFVVISYFNLIFIKRVCCGWSIGEYV